MMTCWYLWTWHNKSIFELHFQNEQPALVIYIFIKEIENDLKKFVDTINDNYKFSEAICTLVRRIQKPLNLSRIEAQCFFSQIILNHE